MATRRGGRRDEPFERGEPIDEARDRDAVDEEDEEGRFSEGQEVLGETSKKEREGRFSDGLEEEPDRDGVPEDRAP